MRGTALAVRDEPAVPPALTFRNDVFMAATTVLLGGKASDTKRAQAVGISRTTLNRLRDGDIQLSLRRALMIATRLGLPVGDLFQITDAGGDYVVNAA